MVKWSGSKRQRLTGRQRDRMIAEEAAQRKKRAIKRAIKAKLDLYGEESLNREEREIVRLFPDFFYPERK